MKELAEDLSPHPYDEAICLTRADGDGRTTSRPRPQHERVLVVCAESCPVGTDVQFSLLLPGGPRKVGGRVVRVTANPVVRPGDRVHVDRGQRRGGDRSPDRRPHASGDAGQAAGRRSRSRPPLRGPRRGGHRAPDGDAPVPAPRRRGRRPARRQRRSRRRAPSARSPSIPPRPTGSRGWLSTWRRRPARALRRAEPRRSPEEMDAPPSKLPPPCGKALPSVLVSRALERDLHQAEERPPAAASTAPPRSRAGPCRLAAQPALAAAPPRVRPTGSGGVRPAPASRLPVVGRPGRYAAGALVAASLGRALGARSGAGCVTGAAAPASSIRPH